MNVRNGGEVSDTFAITNGVKQGCVLAPTLSSIFLSAMLEDAFRYMGDGVYIQSRYNANLYSFTLQREDKNLKHTCEITAFCRRQRTNCRHSRGDPEDCQCIIKVRPQDQDNKDRSDVPTELYNKNSRISGSIIARDSHIQAELQKGMSKASMSFRRLREIL